MKAKNMTSLLYNKKHTKSNFILSRFIKNLKIYKSKNKRLGRITERATCFFKRRNWN